MLPIRFPECFPDEAIADYSKWLERVSTVANIMVCISRSVASEVRQWLSQRGEEQMCPRVSYFYLGGELEVIQDCEFSELENECYRDIYQRPYMLMVGTVEPRKGHAQVVDAFELLWSRGEDMQLVIVGKKGWMVDYIANRMRELGRQQPKFKWIENASDALLRKLYGTATCVIVASYGEGFGLPLIEAAHYDVPVICRNIPVFREVAGEHAYYFDTLEGGVLADVIEDWKHFNRYGYAPSSRGMRAITWRNSAKQLMAAII
jgi:glycosyltransferase involved in cell wall biosynthesis